MRASEWLAQGWWLAADGSALGSPSVSRWLRGA